MHVQKYIARAEYRMVYFCAVHSKTTGEMVNLQVLSRSKHKAVNYQVNFQRRNSFEE